MPINFKLKSGETISLVEKVALLDFETYYDDEYSISNSSYYHYTRDPRFRAYRLSIVTNTGLEWVGDPKDAPWDKIRDYVWVSFNTSFDKSVYQSEQERGRAPAWMPIFWGDAMSVCAYLHSPRSLAKAMLALYGIKVDKSARAEAKGKQWEEFTPAAQQKMDKYALDDGRHALRIWMDHIHLIPSKELRIADLIAARGLKGIGVDVPGAEKDMQVLQRIIFSAEQKIPWRETDKILSTIALAAACRDSGIPPPPSLDMKDEECAAWEDEYGEKYPWVGAMRDWRRMNSLLQKYQMILSRVKPDGRAEFSIKYLGTFTGRTAAGEKGYETDRKSFNLLNLPRSPFYVRSDYTVVHRKAEIKEIEAHVKQHKALPDYIVAAIDLRKKLIPGPGMKFVIIDLAQIEARITNWFGRDKETLDLVRSGISVYEAHARRFMAYKPKEGGAGLKKDEPATYSLAKARELALGFQAGHIQFIKMAPTYVSDEEAEAIFSKPVTRDAEDWYLSTLDYQPALREEYPKLDRKTQVARVNSQIQVLDFRRKKKWLPPLWRKLHIELQQSIGGTHETILPSGRKLKYFDVTREGTREVKARTEINGAFRYIYGGKILANAVSATARDLFVDGQLLLDDAGIDVVLDVYDENVLEVPLDFDPALGAKIMTTNPSWAKTLPLGAEVEESLYYKK